MISFLYYNGFKIKDNRSPGTAGITFDAPTATFHQDNAYTGNPLHGLFKLADDRVVSPNMFLSAKYAYFNTGFLLTPMGGMGLSSGRDLVAATSYGSTVQSTNIRPQMTVNADLNSFFSKFGAAHDVKYGVGFRRVNATTGTLWPGNGLLSLRQTASTSFAQIFREGSGTNRTSYVDMYVGDSISRGRATVDVGVRYDHQGGRALASHTAANPAFPTVVPGLDFAGYEAPFTWNTLSPRAGFTYALDATRRTIARASYSRFAGQLESGTVGFMNPSSTAGVAVYRWNDLNGDHLASADEVLLNQFVAAAGGFNPANPAAVTSSNRINPNLQAPQTQSVVAGVDRELMGRFRRRRALHLHAHHEPDWEQLVGGDAARRHDDRRLHGGPDAHGHAARRQRYSIPTYISEPGEGDGGRQRLPAHQLGRLQHGLPRRRVLRDQAPREPVDGAHERRDQQRARALRSAGDVRHERQPDAHGDRAARGRRAVRAVQHGQFGGRRVHQREVAGERERHVSGAARLRDRARASSAGRAIRSRCSARRRLAPTPASTSWSHRRSTRSATTVCGTRICASRAR